MNSAALPAAAYQLSLAIEDKVHSFMFRCTAAQIEELSGFFNQIQSAPDCPEALVDGYLSPCKDPLAPSDFIYELYSELCVPEEGEDAYEELKILCSDLGQQLRSPMLTLQFSGVATAGQEEDYLVFELMGFPKSALEQLPELSDGLERMLRTEGTGWTLKECPHPSHAPSFEEVGAEVLRMVRQKLDGKPKVFTEGLEHLLRPSLHQAALDAALPAPSPTARARMR